MDNLTTRATWTAYFSKLNSFLSHCYIPRQWKLAALHHGMLRETFTVTTQDMTSCPHIVTNRRGCIFGQRRRGPCLRTGEYIKVKKKMQRKRKVLEGQRPGCKRLLSPLVTDRPRR